MNEETQTTKVKKGGKAKKIIIAVTAIIIILAIVVGILMATGVLDVNLTKKSKMAAGVEKLGESFTSPLTNIMENADENGTNIKILNNINSESATEFSTQLSAKIDELEIEELSTSDQNTIDTIKDIVNMSSIGLDVRYDGGDSAYVNLNGKIDDTEISGEVLYNGEELGMRSEEINSNWLVLTKDDLTEMLEAEGINLDDFEKIMEESKKQSNKLAEAINIDEKTQEEITERYEKVLEDYIDEKSKDIEQESTKVEVNGKEKSCKKLTLELDDDDIKDLLKQYIKTFKDDKQLKEVLTNVTNAYAEIIKSSGSEYEAEELQKAVDEIYNNIDEITNEIDELDLENVSLELVVYATNTNVYRTDIIINTDSVKVKVETTFNKETTVTEVKAAASGMSIDIGKMTLTEKENSVNLKLEPGKYIKENIGDFTAEIEYKTENSKSELTLKVDAGEYGKGTISLISEITKNEDKAYEENSTINIDVNVPNYIVSKMSLNAKTNIVVGNVSIPTISEKESVNLTDETAVNEYLADSEKNITDLLEKLKDIDALSDIIEAAEDELVNIKTAEEINNELTKAVEEDQKNLEALEEQISEFE